MSASWLIIRTDHSKELYVERQIANMGYGSWCPVEVRSCRIHRLSKTRKATEHPVLPKRLFAAVPAALCGLLMKIRYVAAIECDTASAPLQIPHRQIEVFRDTIDRLNRDTLALIEMGRPKQKKAQWRDMKEALEAMIKQAGEQLEQVA